MHAVEQSEFVRAALTRRKKMGPACFTCSLPPSVLSDIHAARAAGATYAGIAQELVARGHCGQEESMRVKYHFTYGHHHRFDAAG